VVGGLFDAEDLYGLKNIYNMKHRTKPVENKLIIISFTWAMDW
jgi:hypothetical protein